MSMEEKRYRKASQTVEPETWTTEGGIPPRKQNQGVPKEHSHGHKRRINLTEFVFEILWILIEPVSLSNESVCCGCAFPVPPIGMSIRGSVVGRVETDN